MIAANVAQLLKSPVGSSRDLRFSETEPGLEASVGVRGPVQGQAHLTRTRRGILVKANYTAVVELACGRCLELFLAPVWGALEEEFLPLIDVLTGEPLPAAGDELTISENHVLDLTEAMRQDLVVRMPLQPLCRESCQGLCPHCGAVLNRQACSCQPEAQASPFHKLSQLLDANGREHEQRRPR